MKVLIDNVEYTDISDLKVVYETDMFAYTYPISQITVRVKTTSNLTTKNIIRYSYSGLQYNVFFIREVKQVNDKEWEVKGESWGSELDKIAMPAAYYEGDFIEDILDEYERCFYNSAINDFRIAYVYESVTPPDVPITTLTKVYFPSQSLRERLITIALITGCVLIDDHSGVLLSHISHFTDESNYLLFTADQVFKKPVVEEDKPMGQLYITKYHYEQTSKGNISSGDRYRVIPPMKLTVPQDGKPYWEKDTSGSTKYCVYESEEFGGNMAFGLYPNGAQIRIDTPSLVDLYAYEAQYRLSQLYHYVYEDAQHQTTAVARNYIVKFTMKEQRTQWHQQIDDMDEADKLGKLVIVNCNNTNKTYIGFIKKLTCTYGSKEPDELNSSPMKNIEIELECARWLLSYELDLVYKYRYIDAFEKRYHYVFPDGYQYSFDTEYQDVLINGYLRYILEPEVDTVSGTLDQSKNEVIRCDQAVYQNLRDEDFELSISAVDEATYFEADGYLYLYDMQ